jgi:hypothetical protein
MNDELTGALCDDFEIPAYALNRLWLDTESGAVQCEGESGLFTLEAPAQVLTLRWNGADGIPLTQLAWQADNLQWGGTIRLGGIVEAIHLTEIEDVDMPMALIFFSAQALKPELSRYPDASQRKLSRIQPPQFLDGIDELQMPMTVPLITFAESPLVTIAQESLMQKNPLFVFGTLAEEEDEWHKHFALPIVWESVTVFAP